MVQLEQYDATPSVSVEPDANVEVKLFISGSHDAFMVKIRFEIDLTRVRLVSSQI